MDIINSDPRSYRQIKDWYARELVRLGVTHEHIVELCSKAENKSLDAFDPYFSDSSFAIPSEEVWNEVFSPLGFDASELYSEVLDDGSFLSEILLHRGYEDLKESYQLLRQAYIPLKKSLESWRNYHRCDFDHCNIWHVKTISGADPNRIHICQKPTSILGRIIRVSCRPGGVVLDPFMGSGSTGVAAAEQERSFIGIERDDKFFGAASEAVRSAYNTSKLPLFDEV